MSLLSARSPQSRGRRELIGRDRECDELVAALDAVAAGRGSLHLLSGEAGIGKTTLADEVESRARERGFCTAWGRAWQAGGAPAFFLFSEALAQIARDLELTPVTFGRGSDGGAAKPEQARLELFSSVREFLVQATKKRPVLLVLDDLHSADHSSLALLEFLVRDVRGQKLLVLGTFRDPEARLDAHTRTLIARLARVGRSLPIGRLEPAAAHLLIQTFAPELAPEFASAVLRTGQGNPLFLDEMLRLCLVDPSSFAGSTRPLPHGVREVIRQRLALLSEAARTALDAAAVVGDEFDLTLLAGVTSMTLGELEDVMQGASAAEVVVAQTGLRFRFGHAMFRDALYRDLAPSRRRALHASVLAALEQRSAQASQTLLAEMAHHALEAAPEGLTRAVDLALSAAEDAVLRVAYDDALVLHERTRKLLESLSLEPALLGEVLLAEALLRVRLGDRSTARERCRAATDIARRLGSAELLARAALTYGTEFSVGLVDVVLIELLREALSKLDERQTALRARVMARLAAAMQPCNEPHSAVGLARQAIALARTLDDESTLLQVAYSSMSAMMDFVVASERMRLNREIEALAAKHGDKPKQLRSFARLVLDHTELGEFAQARNWIERYESLARTLNLPHYLYRAPLFRAMLCLAEGHLEQAELLRRQAEACVVGEDPDARRALMAHRHGALRVSERLDELGSGVESEIARSLDGVPDVPSGTAALLALVGSRNEDRDATRKWLSRVAPDSWFWVGDPMAVMMLGESAALLGEARRCSELYDTIAFASGVDVTLGLFGFLWDGPVERVQALLADACGRWPDAVRHFESALSRLERLATKPYLARTRYEYARALLARGEDREKAMNLLASAAELAAELTLPTLERLIAARRAPAAAQGAPAFAFALEGEVWTLSWDGPPVRLKDSKGQQMLARLVAAPEREIHARELAGGSGDRVEGGDAGELLDERARKEYATRLKELRAELEEAERFGDLGRCARLREEIEFLTAELSRAVGLGGRARRAGSANERARVAVQRRIRDAIQRIEASAPAIGRHLSSTVYTGAFCVYRPSNLKRS
jgi:hypothetical protein